LDFGHIGQGSGTLDEGLAAVDELATEYEKLILFAQIDFAKSTGSLVLAPFSFPEIKFTERRWPKA
jgi:hypothetical protein